MTVDEIIKIIKYQDTAGYFIADNVKLNYSSTFGYYLRIQVLGNKRFVVNNLSVKEVKRLIKESFTN